MQGEDITDQEFKKVLENIYKRKEISSKRNELLLNLGNYPEFSVITSVKYPENFNWRKNGRNKAIWYLINFNLDNYNVE